MTYEPPERCVTTLRTCPVSGRSEQATFLRQPDGTVLLYAVPRTDSTWAAAKFYLSQDDLCALLEMLR